MKMKNGLKDLFLFDKEGPGFIRMELNRKLKFLRRGLSFNNFL
jgi:hypothetical protein